jgi:hypothetical protein
LIANPPSSLKTLIVGLVDGPKAAFADEMRNTIASAKQVARGQRASHPPAVGRDECRDVEIAYNGRSGSTIEGEATIRAVGITTVVAGSALAADALGGRLSHMLSQWLVLPATLLFFDPSIAI